MDTEKLGQAHEKAVAIIDRYAKSHHAAALMLGTLCELEQAMMRGESTEATIQRLFVDPLAGRLLKIYAKVKG